MTSPTTTKPPEANQFLYFALKARIPTVHVKTDEILHVREILEFIAGKAVVQLKGGLEQMMVEIQSASPGTVYITNDETLKPTHYMALKGGKCTCVFINNKVHPLHLISGQMVAPTELIRKELEDLRTSQCAPLEDLLPAIGGLTLKDVYESSRITLERDKKLTPNGLSKTRQVYPQKLKGISQIATAFDFYDVPPLLKAFVAGSLQFFHADAPMNQLAPRGLLMDGPPGTGKTMGAKFLADHLGVPLYRLDIAGIKGKYVGESEGALQAALAQLDQAAPCVCLIDEVEKFFQQGAQNGDSGVTSGLLGQLLWWLQEHSSRVLTVMTTNSAKTIPPELHREGRVDQTLVFNGLPTLESVLAFGTKVLESLEKKFAPLTNEERAGLVSKVNAKLGDASKEGAVPQVKVNQMVTDAYKAVLSARKPS